MSDAIVITRRVRQYNLGQEVYIGGEQGRLYKYEEKRRKNGIAVCRGSCMLKYLIRILFAALWEKSLKIPENVMLCKFPQRNTEEYI